jgi:membrane-associated phospholipid phosphatase
MDVIWQLEVNITLFFQSLGTWLVAPMKFFSFLGTEEAYIILLPIIYWCIDSIIGIRVAFMLIFAGVFNGFFKILFHSPRPYWFDARVKALSSETSFGMPSGHAQLSSGVLGILASSVKKAWFTWMVVFIVIMIGLSRIVLGVHFTSDVLAGWLLGGLGVWLFIKYEKPVVSWFTKRSFGGQIRIAFILAMVIILISIAAVFSLGPAYAMPAAWVQNALQDGAEAPYPIDISGAFTLAGIFFGMLSGYMYLVHKFGGYDAHGTLAKRILRLLVGIVGVAVFYLGLGKVFPNQPDLLSFTLRFIRYSLVGLWVAAGAPLVFFWLKLAEKPAKS